MTGFVRARYDLAPEKRLPMPMMYNHGHWSHFDEKTENGLHA